MSWCFYLLVHLSALLPYFYLHSVGWPMSRAILVASLSIALLLTLGETVAPYRRDWSGWRNDTPGDLLYILLVQIVFTRALESVWFSRIPALPWSWFQSSVLNVASMLLLGEFARYWLHRLSHRLPFLWRFHSVHHSPDRLYWWNTSRFHFVEKALQMGCESLLFHVIGFPPVLIGAYLLIYSAQGLMQHVNMDLRFGPLNYLISSVEQHRWHHSRILDESNRNFANKLAIYDLLFGTFYLPQDRSVERVGVDGIVYPRSIWAQTLTPFSGVVQFCAVLVSCAVGIAIWLRTIVFGSWTWSSYRWLAWQSDFGQTRLLHAILRRHERTSFGRKFDFSRILTVPQYRSVVPIHEYEQLRPWIMKQDETGQLELNDELPLFFATTSGTTDRPKYIPVTKANFRLYRSSQMLWLYFASRFSPGFLFGRFVVIVGSAVEGHMPSGTPYGSTSGQIHRSFPRLVRSKYVVPDFVLAEENATLKYLTILRLSAQEENVTWLGTANPSTLVQLERLLNLHVASLISDLRGGGFQMIEKYQPGHRQELTGLLRANEKVAARIEAIHLRGERIALPMLFPRLRLISTWQSGGCRIAFEQIRSSFDSLLSRRVRFHDIGYVSSEFRGTIPMVCESPAGIPNIRDVHFEFMRTGESDDAAKFLALQDLGDGQEYLVYVTTPCGLFRYKMNDIVRVAGRWGRLPLLEFVQKGKGVTSITGEKLYESQVRTAVSKAQAELEQAEGFFIALADERSARYVFLFEQTMPAASDAVIDRHLAAINIEYAAKRASARLEMPMVVVLRSGFESAYREFLVAQGQRESQLKIQCLQYQKDFQFAWTTYR